VTYVSAGWHMDCIPVNCPLPPLVPGCPTTPPPPLTHPSPRLGLRLTSARPSKKGEGGPITLNTRTICLRKKNGSKKMSRSHAIRNAFPHPLHRSLSRQTENSTGPTGLTHKIQDLGIVPPGPLAQVSLLPGFGFFFIGGGLVLAVLVPTLP